MSAVEHPDDLVLAILLSSRPETYTSVLSSSPLLGSIQELEADVTYSVFPIAQALGIPNSALCFYLTLFPQLIAVSRSGSGAVSSFRLLAGSRSSPHEEDHDDDDDDDEDDEESITSSLSAGARDTMAAGNDHEDTDARILGILRSSESLSPKELLQLGRLGRLSQLAAMDHRDERSLWSTAWSLGVSFHVFSAYLNLFPEFTRPSATAPSSKHPAPASPFEDTSAGQANADASESSSILMFAARLSVHASPHHSS
jgi:hypothetical protein